jgi:acetyltransferase-like isoleucine patch superfamily enzyme
MSLITRVWFKLLKIWWQITVPIRLRMQGVELGKDVRFYGMPIVSVAKGSRICLGDRVVLCSDSRFTALGVNHPVILRTLRVNAEIAIGYDTGISGGSICAASRVELGHECLIGANVTIADTDFHPIKSKERRFSNDWQNIAVKPVKIGSNVFIGTYSSILKGVTIEENSVIGACSVVTRDISKNEIWAGNPSCLIKKLNDD